MSDEVSRRNPAEIMEILFKVLDPESFINTARLAEKAGLSWKTAKSYLQLIWKIQRGPQVFATKSGRSFLWRKAWGELPKEVVVA